MAKHPVKMDGKSANPQRAPTPTDCPVILHISDLHFGRDQDQDGRTLVFNELIREVHKLGTIWNPTYLCITGDIANKGAPDEYKKAASWLVNFIKEFSIGPDFVFICPGNHDVNWNVAKKCKKPRSKEIIDALLTIPLPTNITKGFNNYRKFLKGMKIPPYLLYKKVPSKTSYLFGIRDTSSNLRFFCCNSCFYSWDKTYKGNLLLGNNLIDHMQAENLIGNESESDIITIALIHHSKEKLDESEYYSLGQRPAAFNRLAEKTQLILMGHEHAQINPWNRSGYGAYDSCIGSVFYEIKHINTFQLFKVNRLKGRYECKYFQWNPSLRKWLERTDIKTDWPFDIGSSSQEELNNSRAAKLADELWNLIQRQDFQTALQRYKAEQDWFSRNKVKISVDLSESLELYFQEINLRSN
jgi:predicted MPP superfamily phosphohydrolase